MDAGRTAPGFRARLVDPLESARSGRWRQPVLEAAPAAPINHRVELHTVAGFLAEHLAFDIAQLLDPADWLTFSEQRLGTVTAGAVFRDDLGLEETRARFTYYPGDVWLYLLAAGWARIGQ